MTLTVRIYRNGLGSFLQMDSDCLLPGWDRYAFQDASEPQYFWVRRW